MPISPAAHSTISSASPCRRYCGASCPDRAPQGVCNRWHCVSSATGSARSRYFVPREYWSLVATLATQDGAQFEARLVGADGKKITRLDIGTGEEAEAFKRDLDIASFNVAKVEAKPTKRHPQPPFTTSTLQQEASRKLGMAPAQTMRVAQKLYEGTEISGETVGLITYMRTDGVDMDPSAVQGARRVIGREYGDAYVPGRTAQIRHQGEECPGGPRGGPPHRSRAPAGAGCALSRQRAGAALRADLEAHHRQPDGICRAGTHHGRYRRQGWPTRARSAAPPARW